ncbi:MAG: hypothetical protein ACK4SZ_01575 [Allosphingosinicella sp.]|uniref:hypothetical protein n=1 Tax=Allosphingosinicella sp. TaxID=2823234 RepID=UPI003953F97A
MRFHAALAATALLALAGCGGGDERGDDGLTAKEREQIDNAAAMVENQQTFDTSADSLVLDENAANAASTDLNTLGAAAANEANAQ